jgi:hypothetical protein
MDNNEGAQRLRTSIFEIPCSIFDIQNRFIVVPINILNQTFLVPAYPAWVSTTSSQKVWYFHIYGLMGALNFTGQTKPAGAKLTKWLPARVAALCFFSCGLLVKRLFKFSKIS